MSGHGDGRWLDDDKNVRLIIKALAVACVLLLLADVALTVMDGHHYHHHTHYSVERIPAFYALFGFLAYAGIVTGAKQLRKVLKRPEDYYDE